MKTPPWHKEHWQLRGTSLADTSPALPRAQKYYRGLLLGNLWMVDFKAVMASQVCFHVVIEFKLWTKQNTWKVPHHWGVKPLDLACWAYMRMRPSQRPVFKFLILEKKTLLLNFYRAGKQWRGWRGETGDGPWVRYRDRTQNCIFFWIVNLCLVKTQVAEFTPK